MTIGPAPDERPEPDRYREVWVERPGDVSVYASATGDPGAPALLILDGIGCSGWAFRRIVPLLAERLCVVQTHYPGHGRSPQPPKPWALSMPDLADHAAAVLDALAIERASVVGFSMGFQVALELYRRHRSRVTALVSLAGPSGKTLSTFQGTDVFGHVLPLLRAATRHASVTTLRLWRSVLPSKWLPWVGLHTQLNPMRIELSDLEFYLRQMAEIHPELFLDMLGEAARHVGEDLLPAVRVPTLVIAGAQDRFVPADALRKIAFAIPTAQWMVIEDGSHALPAEYGPELAARLLEFTDELA
ncbi:MAG: alpha/beta hydrolase [Deltaproteobacteria bacterium]|nr:alpha/beta hydrolase [Nannocystaceae bacterium]